MKKLISSGQASIYDRDEYDSTSLYFAVMGRSSEICSLLRREGIFTRLQHEDLWLPLMRLTTFSDGPIESEKLLFRSITPPENDDEDWFSERWGKGSMTYAHLIALRHTGLQSATEKLDQLDGFLRSRLELKFILDDSRASFTSSCNFCPYFTQVLCDNAVLREIESRPSEYKWVLHAISWIHAHQIAPETEQLIASAFALAVRAGLNLHQTANELPSFWREIVIFENSFHGDMLSRSTKSTPLGALCLYWLTLYATKYQFWAPPKNCARFFNERLQCWVSAVQSLGTDLVKYAEREVQNICEYLRSYANVWWNGGPTFTLSVGPHPEDWHVSPWNPCETYARHFWQWVAGEPVLDHMAESILTRKRAMNNASFDDAKMPGRWREDGEDFEQLKDSLMDSGDHVLDSLENDLLNFSDEAFFGKYEVDKGRWVIQFSGLWVHG